MIYIISYAFVGFILTVNTVLCLKQCINVGNKCIWIFRSLGWVNTGKANVLGLKIW